MFVTSHFVVKTLDLAFTGLSFPFSIFIIGTSFISWIKNKGLNVANQIIFGIGVFSYVYSLLGTYRHVYYIRTNNHISFDYKGMIVLLLFNITVSCNLWFCTWLCVYFCLKIVRLNMKFYIYLQKKFQEKITCLLLLSVLVNFVLGCLNTWGKMGNYLVEPAPGVLNHTSLGNMAVNIIHALSVSLSTVSYLVAFLLFSSSALTIVISLLRHVKRVHVNTEDSRSPSVEAHIHAAKTMTSLLALNILYVISFLTGHVSKYNVGLLYVISLLTSMISLLSCVALIKGNRQLDMTLTELVGCCCCSETSNNPATV